MWKYVQKLSGLSVDIHSAIPPALHPANHADTDSAQNTSDDLLVRTTPCSCHHSFLTLRPCLEIGDLAECMEI